MKNPIASSANLAILASIALSTPAFAQVIIDYASVGNAGNAADASGYGAVAYAYQIAKNEVTVSQYAQFLNAAAQTDNFGMWYPSMEINPSNNAGIGRAGSNGSYIYTVTGSGQRPISSVSWYNAARFTNWMHNGQGSGSTETGAYTLIFNSGIIIKNAAATVWLPSEDEWYKAAYYDPTKNANAGGYWLHANQSDTLAGNTIGAANSANYNDGDYVGSGTSSFPNGNGLTDVGAYGANSDSYYGTNDQGGNLIEWTDGVIGFTRAQRGGSWTDQDFILDSTYRDNQQPADANWSVGFRVVTTPVPEPSAVLLTFLAVGASLTRRSRSPL